MQARTLTPSESPIRTQETDAVLYYDPPVYHRTSTFRSRHIELNIRSPSVDYVEDPKFIGQPIPVFYGKDSVGGTVITTIPALISIEHHLTISIEGAFFWIAPQKEPQSLPLSPPLPKRIKHVFLSSTSTFSLSPSPPDSPLKPYVSIRSVFQDGIRKTIFRRTRSRSRRHMGKTVPQNDNPEDPHVPSDPAKTIHSFSFPLPVIIGRKIPSTISVSRLCQSGIRGRWYAEGAQIAYKLTANVYPVAAGDEDARILEEQLEAPIFIESSDSSDIGEEQNSESWSHSTLACLKNIPFLCTLALPQRASFSRSGSITFYVLFSTLPKSEALARRIVKGASIRVSLIRQLRLDPGITIPTPTLDTRHSDKTQPTKGPRERSRSPPHPAESRLPKIFTWQKKPSELVWPDHQDSASRAQTKSPLLKDKPLPALPSESSSVYEHVICSVESVGFPKRVAPKDPFLSFESSSGPEGIFKGQLRLSNELSNTIDWPGISLSYFVEASVRFEDDVVRARDRVRLVEAYI